MASFYKRNTQFKVHHESDTLYWEAYSCLFKNEDGKLKKITKKELKEVQDGLEEAWGDFEELAAEFPMPKYKGHRKPIDYSWLDCDPKMYFELCQTLPMLYAKVMKGAVVELKGAEADDIAGVVCKRAQDRGNEVILISGDSDWAQLPAYYPNTTYYNPYRSERLTHEDRETIIPKVKAKIVGGDAGDGIKGCAQISGWGPIGETTAAKIVEAGEIHGKVDPVYLDHNKRMVRLHPDTIPDDIVAGIDRSINEARKSSQDVTWEDLELPSRRQQELKIDAKATELWEIVTEK